MIQKLFQQGVKFLAMLCITTMLAPSVSYAEIYAPGATLDPSCLPTDANCYVQAPITGVATTSVFQTPVEAQDTIKISATSTPADTTARLYNVGNVLYWNGSAVGGTYFAGNGLSLASSTFNLDINSLTQTTAINASNTLAIYDGTSVKKITRNDFLQGLTSALVYQGTWDANTNTPFLSNGTGTVAYMYVASAASSTVDLGNGPLSVNSGDFIIYNASNTKWEVAPSGSPAINGLVGPSFTFNAPYGLTISTSTATNTITFIPNYAGTTTDGIISTTTQSFAGSKTFTGSTTLATTTATQLSVSGSLLASSTFAVTGASNLYNTLFVQGTSTLATTTATQLSIGSLTGLLTASNGLVGTSSILSLLSYASTTADGIISTTTQSFAGAKTFASSTTLASTTVNGLLSTTQGITIASSTPATTTNALYNIGGSLYWNAGALATAATTFAQNGNAFGTTATLGTTDANSLRFIASSTEAMRILTDGKVGIGTATSTAGLTVAASTGDIFALSSTLVSPIANWAHRQKFTVTNANASTLTNHQVSMTINTAALVSSGKMLSNGNDIRIVAADGTTVLNHFLDSGMNSASTVIWFKAPSLAVGSNTFYIYYGNSGAANVSNSTNVFELFDEFTSGLSQWTTAGGFGTSLVSGSASAFSTGGAASIVSNATFTSGVIAEFTDVMSACMDGFDSATDAGFRVGTGSSGLAAGNFGDCTPAGSASNGPDTLYNNSTRTTLGTNSSQANAVVTIALKNSTQADVTIGGVTTSDVSFNSSGSFNVSVGTRFDGVLANQRGIVGVGRVVVRKYAASTPTVSFGAEITYGSATSRLTVNTNGNILFDQFVDGLVAFNTTGSAYERRLRLTAGASDTGDNSEGASIDLHGNDNANAGRLDLVAGGTTGSITAWTNNILRMIIDESGNIGIGTTTPGSTLTVAGDGFFTSGLTTLATSTALGFVATQNGLIIASSTPATTTLALYNLGSTLYWNGSAVGSGGGLTGGQTGYLSYWNSGTTLGTSTLYFATSTGNIGIGTTTPANKLHIEGGISISSSTPLTTTNALYNVGGSLYWNGSAVGSAGNVLAEYGENNSITNAQTTTSAALVDVAGSSFTLPSAGVWEVEYNVYAYQSTTGQSVLVAIADNANAVVANSVGNASPNTSNINGATLISQKVLITTTGAATYKLRFATGGAGTATISNVSTATGASAGATSKITYKKISGNVAVTGQSVDYVQARRTADVGSVTVGSDFVWNEAVSGNIPLNTGTGVFTLTAGKTYKLSAGIRFISYSASGANFSWRWVDATSNTALVNGANGVNAQTSDSNSDRGTSEIIYTPSTDQTVKLRVTGGVGSATWESSSSYANITQLGTSAFTGDTIVAQGGNTTANTLTIGTLNNNALSFIASSTEAMRILANGYIGIGTTTATNRLHVEGGITIGSSTPATTTNALYNNAGSLYWNGSAVGSGGGVVASYIRTSGISGGCCALGAGAVLQLTTTDSFGSDIINASGVITLKAGKTYRLLAGDSSTSGGTDVYRWRVNPTTFIGTARGGSGQEAEALYTPSSDVTVSLINQAGNGISSIWSFIEVIAGNAPVTGQSVDYVQVSGGANYTLGSNGTAVIPASASTVGNVPYNTSTGIFTLTAGKTYRLEGAISMSANADVYYQWRDITSNTLLGTAGTVYQSASSRNALASAIYTPASNVTARLEIISGGGASVDSSGDGRRTFMTVTQLGTSAMTSESVVAVGGNTLSSTGGALTIGTLNNNALAFTASSTEAMRILSNGYIGIGTTTATNRLHVEGGITIGSSTPATTTNALYNNAGSLYWNGSAVGSGGGVVASYMFLVGSTVVASTGTQLPFTAVRAQFGSDITQSGNGVILKAGKTYRLTADMSIINTAGSPQAGIEFFNVTSSAVMSASGNNALKFTHPSTSNYSDAGDLVAIVTPAVDTTVVVRAVSTAANTTLSPDKFLIEVIAGNAAVTGQSVDYVNARTTGAQTAVGNNTNIIFQTLSSGNIPLNTTTGVFTLTAGKTYKMSASLRTNNPSVSGGYLAYTWVDATTNTALVPGSSALTISDPGNAGYGSNPVVEIIYTPSSNQTVRLRSIANSGTQNINPESYATITQLGSSAITGDSMVAVGGNQLSGTGNTLTIGTLNNNTLTFSASSTAKMVLGTTTTNYLKLNGYGSAGASLITDASGNVTLSSDAKLKTNETAFLRGLDSILGLAPTTYNWTSGSGLDRSQTYTGFIAQNVQDFIPEAVGTAQDGTLTLADRPILAALVNATKELNSKSEVHSLQIGTIANLVGLSATDLDRIKIDYLAGKAEETDTKFAELKAGWDTLRADYEAQKLDLVALASTTDALSELVAGIATSTASTTATTTDTDADAATEGSSTLFGRIFDPIIAWFADKANGIGNFFAKKVFTDEICLTDSGGDYICLTADDIRSLGSAKTGTSTPIVDEAPAANPAATSTDSTSSPQAVTITINGDEITEVKVDEVYTDEGATAEDTSTTTPVVVRTYQLVGGTLTEVSSVNIDTATTSTHQITYRVLAEDGTTVLAEATRTVNVTEAAADDVLLSCETPRVLNTAGDACVDPEPASDPDPSDTPDTSGTPDTTL